MHNQIQKPIQVIQENQYHLLFLLFTQEIKDKDEIIKALELLPRAPQLLANRSEWEEWENAKKMSNEERNKFYVAKGYINNPKQYGIIAVLRLPFVQRSLKSLDGSHEANLERLRILMIDEHHGSFYALEFFKHIKNIANTLISDKHFQLLPLLLDYSLDNLSKDNPDSMGSGIASNTAVDNFHKLWHFYLEHLKQYPQASPCDNQPAPPPHHNKIPHKILSQLQQHQPRRDNGESISLVGKLIQTVMRDFMGLGNLGPKNETILNKLLSRDNDCIREIGYLVIIANRTTTRNIMPISAPVFFDPTQFYTDYCRLYDQQEQIEQMTNQLYFASHQHTHPFRRLGLFNSDRKLHEIVDYAVINPGSTTAHALVVAFNTILKQQSISCLTHNSPHL